MDDEDFIAAMSEGIPPIAPPEPLAMLNDMHAHVRRMIDASPQRTQRTQAEDREGVE